jgi:hypothetical protein
MAACLVCAILAVLFWVLPAFLREALWAPTNPSAKSRLFWIQTVSGNWSPDNPPVGPRSFAASAVAAILLNNGLVWIVLLAIWRTILTWRRNMRLSQAFVARDQMNKQALFKLLGDDPETMRIIKEAFREGEKRWTEELDLLFGTKEASRLRELLPTEIR